MSCVCVWREGGTEGGREAGREGGMLYQWNGSLMREVSLYVMVKKSTLV